MTQHEMVQRVLHVENKMIEVKQALQHLDVSHMDCISPDMFGTFNLNVELLLNTLFDFRLRYNKESKNAYIRNQQSGSSVQNLRDGVSGEVHPETPSGE